MKIVNPSVHIEDELNGSAVLRKLEQCGRTCYKSEHKATDDSARDFIAGIVRRGHESVLEHVNVTARIVCDRGVSHEIVRHRLASYSQESTRYCNYSSGLFDSEITVIKPLFLEEHSKGFGMWETACKQAETAYFDLLNWGCSPQEARSVLPNSLKAELVMTCNLREWRHFFKLRCSPGAHPQMREVANMLLGEFRAKIPVIFDDLAFNEKH